MELKIGRQLLFRHNIPLFKTFGKNFTIFGNVHLARGKYDPKEDYAHTAPQHRQYLSFDGIGSGTPSEREKQYYKHKASTAVQNVYEHRINKLNAQEVQTLIIKDKKRVKDIKTRYGMERLVEDLIVESMQRGEFDNLSGNGKPLPQRIEHNPYVDFTTHKMNQVLIDNGFAPEWITLQKEIREEKESLLNDMSSVKQKLSKPVTYEDMEMWESHVNKWKGRVDQLNSKINKYNLLVPILMKQMFLFDLHKTCETMLKEHEDSKEQESSVKS
uniref:DnaJ homolog subfamily C member 28 n=1 Tax=Cacopsylla melanoneura TaxID=428564 RepID=A0A8D9EBD3_9HEMI